MKIFCQGKRQSCSNIFNKLSIPKKFLDKIKAKKILRRYVKHTQQKTFVNENFTMKNMEDIFEKGNF